MLVSIPERVWGGLELDVLPDVLVQPFVSIPERVWGGLEPSPLAHRHQNNLAFQSLRGFGVGWSSHGPPKNKGPGAPTVSIPERVWGGLERSRLRPRTHSARFQSLRGFGVGWSKSKPKKPPKGK